MDNEKKNIEKEGAAAGRPGADVDSVIKQLMGIDSMFQDFINAETEGMIICENCYDNVFGRGRCGAPVLLQGVYGRVERMAGTGERASCVK